MEQEAIIRTWKRQIRELDIARRYRVRSYHRPAKLLTVWVLPVYAVLLVVVNLQIPKISFLLNFAPVLGVGICILGWKINFQVFRGQYLLALTLLLCVTSLLVVGSTKLHLFWQNKSDLRHLPVNSLVDLEVGIETPLRYSAQSGLYKAKVHAVTYGQSFTWTAPRYWIVLRIKPEKLLPMLTNSDLKMPIPAKTQLEEMKGTPEIPLGTRIRVKGKIKNFPIFEDTLGMINGNEISICAAAPNYLKASAGLRKNFHIAMEKISAPVVGLLKGVAIGDDEEIGARVQADFRFLSLTHITAVSGAHIAIVANFWGAILGLIKVKPRGKIWGTFAAILLMMLLVGPEPAVLRAGMMSAISTLALFSTRPLNASVTLALTVVVILVLDPSMIFSKGFQISVLACSALVLGSEALTQKLTVFVGSKWAPAISVPLIAQAACLPLLLEMNTEFSLLALPANMLVALLLGPLVMVSLLSGLLAGFSLPIGQIIARVGACIGEVVLALTTYIADFPGAGFKWPDGWKGQIIWILLVLGFWKILGKIADWEYERQEIGTSWWLRWRRKIFLVGVILVAAVGIRPYWLTWLVQR